MYTQVVYAHSVFERHIMAILNQYISEKFTTKPNEILTKDAYENIGLGFSVDQEIAMISFDVKRAMLEAERRKAEALNMLRFRETLR